MSVAYKLDFPDRHYDPRTGRFISEDPIEFDGEDTNLYRYVENNPIIALDPYGLYSTEEFMGDSQNFSAGIASSLTFGLSEYLYNYTGASSSIDKCSAAYKSGYYGALAFSTGRLAYAGAAKVGARLASSGKGASAFRSTLKGLFRGGSFKGYRNPNLSGLSDFALRAKAGRTNLGVNSYALGTLGAAAGQGGCGCE